MDLCIIFVGTKKDIIMFLYIPSMKIEYLIDAQEDNFTLSCLDFKCNQKYIYFS